MVLSDENLTQEHKNYLVEKVKSKKLWVKAYIKDKFSCGMCTSSRIEAKHKVLKTYLNSSNRLIEIFETFKKLELQEISKFSDEVKTISHGNKKIISKFNLIKDLKNTYSTYSLNILQNNLVEGLNYIIQYKRSEKVYGIKILFV